MIQNLFQKHTSHDFPLKKAKVLLLRHHKIIAKPNRKVIKLSMIILDQH